MHRTDINKETVVLYTSLNKKGVKEELILKNE